MTKKSKKQIDWMDAYDVAKGWKKGVGGSIVKTNANKQTKTFAPLQSTIYYHANCPDGSTAAMILEMYERTQGPGRVALRPIKPGAKSFVMRGQQRIYMVDVVAAPETVKEAKGACKEFILLDHHKTSIEALKGVHECHIDCGRCGCKQAIEWCAERGHTFSHAMGKLVEYINDMDLAENKLPRTGHIQRLLRGIRTPKAAHAMLKRLNSEGFDALADEGQTDWEDLQRWLNEVVPQAEEIDIAGVTFATLKLDGWTPDASDLGNRIAEVWGMPACVRFDGSRGEVHMLRSERGVGMDVERVAREMGGGGHKHAAAFTKA